MISKSNEYSFKNTLLSMKRFLIIFLIIFQLHSLCGNEEEEWEESPQINSYGSLDTPYKIPKITLPLTTGIDFSRESFFAVTGLTPGISYTVTIDQLTDGADLFVYDADHTFTSVACSSSLAALADESCSFVASGAAVFIKLREDSLADIYANISLRMRVE